MNSENDEVMLKYGCWTEIWQTFALISAEAFVFLINLQLFITELTTMLLKTENWKIFQFMELVSDSEKMAISTW